MNRLVMSLATALGAGALIAGLAAGADQTILGRSFIVKNPGDPVKRKIASAAKEIASPNTIVGDPTIAGSAGGAILVIAANGASATTQTFPLPQGTTVTGKPFWRASGVSGFKYKDPKGEQGAVKTVLIRKNASGVFSVKVTVRGKNGPVNVVPPNPGTDGYVTLTLGSGDRYCLQFGADGTVTNKSAQLFKVRRPVIEACPGATTTTTTAPTSTTTSTTLSSSPSRAFLDPPLDLLD